MEDFCPKTFKKNCKPPKLRELPALGMVRISVVVERAGIQVEGVVSSELRRQLKHLESPGQGVKLKGLCRKGCQLSMWRSPMSLEIGLFAC